MVFSELSGADMPLIIEDLLENGGITDQRVVSLLSGIASDNIEMDSVNIHILKYRDGELSEKDLLIAINRYKSSKQGVVD